MEAKKPRSAPSSPSRTPTTPNAWFEILNPDQASPFKGSQCFGASSELTFRTQDADVDADPFKCFSPSRVDDFGFDDDFFATYIDFEKLEEKEGNNGHDDKNDNLVDGEGSRRGGGRGRGRGKRKEKGNNANTQPKKGQKRGSPGGQRSCLEGDGGLVEPRKAMAAKELAELWTIDPKRAKRIMANRQSAARSKERKAQYVLELEEKVKTLHSEMNSLTTQLASIQREITDLAAERSDLKLELQTFGREIELCDAQNEELKLETEMLADMSMNQMPHSPSSSQSQFLQLPASPLSQHKLSLPLHNSQPNISPHYLHTASSQPLNKLI